MRGQVRVVVVGATVMTALAGCSSDPSSDGNIPIGDPLDQMSISFEGSPSRNEIQRKVDASFAATGTQITEENYTRAGSVLIAFRKERGLNEMQILDCIPRRAADPRVSSLSFPSVAAVCVTDMATGNYP